MGSSIVVVMVVVGMVVDGVVVVMTVVVVWTGRGRVRVVKVVGRYVVVGDFGDFGGRCRLRVFFFRLEGGDGELTTSAQPPQAPADTVLIDTIFIHSTLELK